MKRRYKFVYNVEIDDPEKPYPAGGDYTHLDRLGGMAKRIQHVNYDTSMKVTLDKIIDKGEIVKPGDSIEDIIKENTPITFDLGMSRPDRDFLYEMKQEHSKIVLNRQNYIDIITKQMEEFATKHDLEWVEVPPEAANCLCNKVYSNETIGRILGHMLEDKPNETQEK